MEETRCVVIGAGPHGLSATAHLRRAGVEPHVFGRPMSFWHTMPHDMLLRSNWTATSIAEHDGPLSLTEYCRASGENLSLPLPLGDFHRYSEWVHRQVVPDVDTRSVVHLRQERGRLVLTLEDGEQIAARHVVCATGIADYVHLPEFAQRLPREVASHTSQHRSFDEFRGRRVLVVGGGQSALECAALAHEAGAEVSVVARIPQLNWLHGGRYHRMLGRYARLVYAPTDVGPMGISRVVAEPGLFGRVPRRLAEPMAARSIRPAGAAWLRDRLNDVPVQTGTQVVQVEANGAGVQVRLDSGDRRTADHLLFGTGYRVDVARAPFLDGRLLADLARRDGYPVLDRGMRSSVEGLSFLGAPAARSVGPTMRFISGGWYAGRAVASAIAPPPTGARARRSGPVPSAV